MSEGLCLLRDMPLPVNHILNVALRPTAQSQRLSNDDCFHKSPMYLYKQLKLSFQLYSTHTVTYTLIKENIYRNSSKIKPMRPLVNLPGKRLWE